MSLKKSNPFVKTIKTQSGEEIGHSKKPTVEHLPSAPSDVQFQQNLKNKEVQKKQVTAENKALRAKYEGK